ncbi:hypothetical protein OIE66_27450 [Nonomuraea sp. NBC_01738]|uniref:hypothetical protein n=1 Tax=Nonomuraea sp. NBC_01738 TaxID=2976003 RepID=UPI002E0E626D|nr:hypothetical protein OIE66_27450 [Nonomuraea sp. NBC_01738]
MRVIVEIAGYVLLLQGVGGLVNTLFGWWQWAEGLLLVNRLPFLSGYEIFSAIVIGVLGFAMIAAAESRKKAG